MYVYPRSRWKARAPRPMDPQGRPREAFIHATDTEDAHRVDRFTEQAAAMLAIQSFHMGVRGWSDIAYHFIIFQPYGKLERARVFQGRSIHAVPAAQEGHNTGTLALAVYGDGNADTMDRSTRYVIEQLIRRFPTITTVGGHRDVVATECPGDKFYASIPRIARASGTKLYKS